MRRRPDRPGLHRADQPFLLGNESRCSGVANGFELIPDLGSLRRFAERMRKMEASGTEFTP